MRGKILFLDLPTIVLRAWSLKGSNIVYNLAYPNGGTDPEAPDCSSVTNLRDKNGVLQPQLTKVSDCVGFAAWAGGFDRYIPPGSPDAPGGFPLYDGYINTDSMLEAPGGWFLQHATPTPGMFIVAHTFEGKWPVPHRVIGHIGVITEVTDPSKASGIQVMHCSPYCYHFTNSTSAIWETDATPWFQYPQHHYVSLAWRKPTPVGDSDD